MPKPTFRNLELKTVGKIHMTQFNKKTALYMQFYMSEELSIQLLHILIHILSSGSGSNSASVTYST